MTCKPRGREEQSHRSQEYTYSGLWMLRGAHRSLYGQESALQGKEPRARAAQEELPNPSRNWRRTSWAERQQLGRCPSVSALGLSGARGHPEAWPAGPHSCCKNPSFPEKSLPYTQGPVGAERSLSGLPLPFATELPSHQTYSSPGAALSVSASVRGLHRPQPRCFRVAIGAIAQRNVAK